MTDEELYLRLIERDEEVFQGLIQAYSPLLWAIASGRLKKSEDIEEIISDTFMRLWQQPEKYDPKRGSLKNYLALIVKSLSLNKVMKREVETSDLEEFANSLSAVPSHAQSKKKFWQRVYEAILTLEEPTREICLRRFFYEMKPAEIQEKMNLPAKEIDNRLYRGKKQLRKLLDQQNFLLELEDQA